MKFVEPIRDRKQITQIKNLLRGQHRCRDLPLFVIGINTALRISDLLQLRLSQFLDETGKIKSKFWIKERKQGKRHEIAINQSIKEALIERYHARKVWARDAWHLTSRWLRKLVSHLIAVLYCQRLGLSPTRFSELLID